jgi:hypothetical protein
MASQTTYLHYHRNGLITYILVSKFRNTATFRIDAVMTKTFEEKLRSVLRMVRT